MCFALLGQLQLERGSRIVLHANRWLHAGQLELSGAMRHGQRRDISVLRVIARHPSYGGPYLYVRRQREHGTPYFALSNGCTPWLGGSVSMALDTLLH